MDRQDETLQGNEKIEVAIQTYKRKRLRSSLHIR
mgnify:FL=1